MEIQNAFLAMQQRLVKNVRKYIYGPSPHPVRDYLKSARPIDLVVHVGAHMGQEIKTYQMLGVRRIVWIEGDPQTYRQLCERIEAEERRSGWKVHQQAVCALVSDTDGQTVKFYRFNNNGASSSLYEPTELLRKRWPRLDTVGEPVELRTCRLETILDEVGIEWPQRSMTLLVLDVQGHEGAVLAGLGRYSGKFDLCECEISQEAIYNGGALYPEIKSIFDRMGYALASHAEEDLPWHGDVVFRRNDGPASVDSIPAQA